MNVAVVPKLPPWRSLSVKVALFTLVIFVACIWLVALVAGWILRADMQRQLGEQQYSTASMVAQELNSDVIERFEALQSVGDKITTSMLDDPATLQYFLEDREVFHSLFNAGTFVTTRDGTAIASVPAAAGRVGLNYMYRDHIATALKQGEPGLSKPIVGQALKVPVVSLAVPIRDGTGTVTGAIVGVIDLTRPSFMSRISDSRYGLTGNYFVVDRRVRQIVQASDKRRILEMLPAPGISPASDQAITGDVKAAVYVNPLGVEVLGSARGVPVTNWYVGITLPTQEAFAPIRSMQRRIAMLALLATLLAVGGTWWMMRRQLGPMLAAIKTLSAFSSGDQTPQPLPVTSQDEVGALIASFNRLLATVREREAALRQSEENLAITLHSIGDAVIATDARGRITRMNPTAERLTGWPLVQALGRDLPEVFHIVNAHSLETSANPVQRVVETGEMVGLANHTALLARDGTVYQISDSAAPILDASGQMVGVVLVFSDVTEQYRVQAALHASEDLYRTVVHWSPNAIVMHRDGRIIYANPATLAMFGAASELDMVGKPIFDFVHPDDQARAQERVKQGLESGRPAPLIEQRLFKLDGTLMDAEVQGIPVVYEGKATVLTALRDITERKQAQQALHNSLQEKVALLHEVHHRVKNNLQVITSLLRLEAGRSSQSDTKAVLQDMQGRIRSMALLHESLYRSGTFASVDLKTYIGQLATQAFRAMHGRGAAVELQLALEPVYVSLDQATPCGLLVNELISNAFKHGFADGRGGTVSVTLQALPGDEGAAPQARLRVSDNGVGLAPDFEARRSQSLGLQLVGDLCRQLHGTLEVGPVPQAVFTVTFAVQTARFSAGTT